ncbi:MAG: hypothetical protein QM589_11225 [Thermomicrobiales bacterium]
MPSRSMSSRQAGRFPWIVAEGQIAFTLLAALGFGLVIAAVVIGAAWKSTVTGSIWEPATNAIPWFAAVLAGHTFHQVVPMLIANGRTRREATIAGIQVIGTMTLTISLLSTLAYVIELVVYRWQGWPRTIGGNHFFTHHDQVGRIFWETLLTIALWSCLGAMVGAAFYRDDRQGWFSLVPAALIMTGVGIFMTVQAPVADNVIANVLSGWGRSLPVATLATAVGLVFTSVILWRIVRDMPLRRWR